MILTEYQELARRTQNLNLSLEDRQRHALYGMGAELAEIFENIKRRDLVVDELSDFCWFVAEYCDTLFFDLADLLPKENPFTAEESAAVEMARIEHCMVATLGKIYSAHQKAYQGHTVDKKEIGFAVSTLMVCVRVIAEIYETTLAGVMEHNVEKLRKRYPDGFDVEHSIHRTI